jgi:transposase-like protein
MSDAINLIEFYNKFANEQACRDYLEKARWGDTITCPKCGIVGESYKYTDGRLFKCGACRKQFTVRVGTIFEDSKLPLQKWFLAIYLATSLKKGISSMQLSKYLGITQKTAWYMLHRVRYAVETTNYDKPLDGDVEMDETYIGGRRPMKKKFDNKTPVVGAVERDGRVVAKATQDASSTTLQKLLREHVAIGANLYTDEWRGYTRSRRIGYNHSTVNHSAYQWKDGVAHTNTIEGFWSHLKRGIDGIYHHVSPKHLQRYCDEYQYRYNTRLLTDFERFETWFKHINKRIMYKELI